MLDVVDLLVHVELLLESGDRRVVNVAHVKVSAVFLLQREKDTDRRTASQVASAATGVARLVGKEVVGEGAGNLAVRLIPGPMIEVGFIDGGKDVSHVISCARGCNGLSVSCQRSV